MAAKSNTIIYFAPHQDDELLSMGVDICNSLDKGKDVHVVLCTDGSSSKVKNILKDGQKCKKHQGEHIYDLSVEEFIKARDDEFVSSCTALGVKKENIHIPESRGKDGAFVTADAEKTVREYLNKIDKNALVCTISSNNGDKQHRDHKALGRAVENLVKKGVIRKRKLFVEPYHYNQIKDNAYKIPVEPEKITAKDKTVTKIKNAIDSYSYWNPEEKRYAVGFHSVTNEFNDYLKDMTNRCFVKIKPENMTLSEKMDWQHKKWIKLQNQKQLYYSFKECNLPDLGDNCLVSVMAGECDKYRQLCQQYNIPLTDKNLKRIADGSSFWCLTDKDDNIMSTGWLAYKHHFYIGETDFEFDMDQSDVALLYNFETKEEYRGKGLYGLLLQSIVANAKEPKEYVIYTSQDNLSSQKGILKAGFAFDGVFIASDKSLNNYLKSKGFINIKRRYRLWGLSVSK